MSWRDAEHTLSTGDIATQSMHTLITGNIDQQLLLLRVGQGINVQWTAVCRVQRAREAVRCDTRRVAIGVNVAWPLVKPHSKRRPSQEEDRHWQQRSHARDPSQHAVMSPDDGLSSLRTWTSQLQKLKLMRRGQLDQGDHAHVGSRQHHALHKSAQSSPLVKPQARVMSSHGAVHSKIWFELRPCTERLAIASLAGIPHAHKLQWLAHFRASAARCRGTGAPRRQRLHGVIVGTLPYIANGCARRLKPPHFGDSAVLLHSKRCE